MAVGRMSVTPWAGPPGTTIDVVAPSWSAVSFQKASGLVTYFVPQKPPAGLASSTTFFGYPQPHNVVSAQHLTITVTNLASDPLSGIVPGIYGIVIVDALESVTVGEFQVLRPGQMNTVPPPGAEFINWWIGPYIPNWKPGGYSGYNAPPGWTFWYDTPEHPSTDLAWWWNTANWGTGTWKWAQLPAHPLLGWSIVWDGDDIHGSNTSLHGWIMQPANPSNPAPGVQWPPWPTVATPPPLAPAAQPPSKQPIPPAMPNAPLPALFATAGQPQLGGVPVGRAGATNWAGQQVPGNPDRREALYFVSDLHLGDASRAEDFVAVCSDPQTSLADPSWVRMMGWLCADVQALGEKELIDGARLIWNGDIIDLWGAGQKPGTAGPGDVTDYRLRLANILQQHPAFFTATNQFLSLSDNNRLVYIRGNHDEAMLRFDHPLMDDLVARLPGNEAKVYRGNGAAVDAYLDDGFALVGEHGNAYDPTNLDLVDFSRLIGKPGPILMMKGQVFVEEFVNWLEMNAIPVATSASAAAFIQSLMLIDNVPVELEYVAYLNSWGSQARTLLKIWAKLANTLRRAQMFPGATWVSDIEKHPTSRVVQLSFAASDDEDNDLVGRGAGGKAQQLADDILAGKQPGLAGGKPLIVGLGHTHEKIWRLGRPNGFTQLYFNSNTWSPKYELSSFNPRSWTLEPIADSAANPHYPIIRVVPHHAVAAGAVDPTDVQPGMDVINDVLLDAPPGRGTWQARVSYCNLPPQGGAPTTATAASAGSVNVEIQPKFMDVEESRDTTEFAVVVQGGTATGYQWAMTPPDPAVGNDPFAAGWNVLSSGGTAATMAVQHTRWCADPDDSRGIVAGPDVLYYEISCSVTVNGTTYATRAFLEVFVHNPLGETSRPELVGWDSIKVAQDATGTWRVTDPGTFIRSAPVIAILVAPTSQFYKKVMTHEGTHADQFVNQAPWTGFWNANGLYANTLSKLTSTLSEADLRSQIERAVNKQQSDDDDACDHTVQDLELGASRADRAVEPHYLEKTDADVITQYPRPPN